MPWVHDANCLLARYTVDSPWHDGGCNLTSWKNEEILARLRETRKCRAITAHTPSCRVRSMTMGEFAGMRKDASAFEFHPPGQSHICLPSGTLRVEFL